MVFLSKANEVFGDFLGGGKGTEDLGTLMIGRLNLQHSDWMEFRILNRVSRHPNSQSVFSVQISLRPDRCEVQTICGAMV